ncbi:MAG: SCP2 sterol-binding domain-containing protein [Deltaproteobacteria bacterium]|nr:SCP2 sterol-binding domain-containing protein [Deltaproteobacteria bacterium]
MSFKSAKEVFETKISEKLKTDPEVAKAVGALVLFHITGAAEQNWVVDCSKSPATVKNGTVDGAALEVTVAEGDFVKLANGELNPQMAFLGGKLKVKGNMGLAIKLGKILT